jgi:hypothetical protein
MPTFCETNRARVLTFEFLVRDSVYCIAVTMLKRCWVISQFVAKNINHMYTQFFANNYNFK